jgi:uncharacterized secreted protein with C-terminal beta-propeller domain
MAKKSSGARLGLVALASAVAGAYFMYGKNGDKNRKKVKSWMFKMRGEVMDNLEKLKDFDKLSYNKVVDEAARHYRALKQVDKKEVDQMVGELKGHWKNISEQVLKNLKKTAVAKKKPAKKKKSVSKKQK